VHLRTETNDSPFTRTLTRGQVLKIPIGHMEGNYFCDESTLAELQRNDRIAFRYATPEGAINSDANPNGSIENIAGILNEGRNVLGMMPHPDRSSESLLGSSDGFKIFESLVGALAEQP
jgi:phosphoribosylformylglycinamidine synthase